MEIEKRVLYLRVSQIKSLDDILTSSDKIIEYINQDQSAAVVFSLTEEPQSDEATREMFAHFVLGLPAVTAAVSHDFSGFSLEFLTLFDKLISEQECLINNLPVSNSYGTDFMKRYRIVAGRKSAYDLKKYLSGNCRQSIRLPNVTIPDYEGSLQEKTDMYINDLFKDKTDFEVNSIAACFVKARRGGKAAFNEESIRFYALIKRKSEEYAGGK